MTIIGTLPNTISDGDIIDAVPVMANFNWIVSQTNQLFASTGSNLVGFLQAGSGAVAETGQAKLRQIVNVDDFGAVGDGTTNDYNAVLAAVNSLASSNVYPELHFTAGKRYLVNSANNAIPCVLFDRPMTVRANGAVIVIPTAYTGKAVQIKANFVIIHNLKVLKPTYSTDAALLTGSGFTYESTLTQSVLYFRTYDCSAEGFQYANVHTGSGSGVGYGEHHGMRTLNCAFADVSDATNVATSYCNDIKRYGGASDPGGLVSNLAGTRAIDIRNTSSFTPTNGHTFYGVDIGGNWGRKLRCEGSGNGFMNVYWDLASSSGTDIEYVNSGSTQLAQWNMIWGGSALEQQVIVNTSGLINSTFDVKRGIALGSPVLSNTSILNSAVASVSGSSAFADFSNIGAAANGTAVELRMNAKKGDGVLVPIGKVVMVVENNTGSGSGYVQHQARDSSGVSQNYIVGHNDGSIDKGLYALKEVCYANASIADDGIQALPTGKDGFITVSCNAECGLWVVSGAGTAVALVVGTANTKNTNTDNNLCVYPAGAGVVNVINRLGTTGIIRFSFNTM